MLSAVLAEVSIKNMPFFSPEKPIDQTKLGKWRPSQKPVTPAQLDILTDIFNNIKQGTGSPLPVRKVENEFAKINILLGYQVAATR